MPHGYMSLHRKESPKLHIGVGVKHLDSSELRRTFEKSYIRLRRKINHHTSDLGEAEQLGREKGGSMDEPYVALV